MKNTYHLSVMSGLAALSLVTVPLIALGGTSIDGSEEIKTEPVMMRIQGDAGMMEGTKGMPVPPEVEVEIEHGMKSNVVVKPAEFDDRDVSNDDSRIMGVPHEMEMNMRMNDDMHRNGKGEDDVLFGGVVDVDIDELMDAEESEDHGKIEIEVDDADEVHTKADFEHFVAHKAKSDEHIRNVSVKDGGKVEVVYAMPVKFLGFWGTTLDTTMSADTSGNVEVDYPWYAIFMKKEFSKKTAEPMLKSELQKEKATLAADANATSTAKVKTFAVPHVLEAMLSTATAIRGSWNLKENVK